MMKRLMVVMIALQGCLSAAFGQTIIQENFDSGQTPGTTPAGWSTKWALQDWEVHAQQNLMTVEEGIGVDGTAGVKYHVDEMLGNYLSVHPTGLNADNLTISMDAQVAITADPVANAPANVNGSIVGLMVVKGSNWWELGGGDVAAWCRSQDGNWGVRLPTNPWITAFRPGNSTVGLPAGGLQAGTSDWFNIRMDLTDNGPATGWSYVTTISAMDGSPIISTPEQPIPTNYLQSGATVYAAIHSGHNELSYSNETKAAVSKISSVTVDNFQFFSTPEGGLVDITGVALEDLVGYSFTSASGNTYSLQYTLDSINWEDTGATAVGDDTEKLLVDPAEDTAGRTYRVLEDPSSTFDWEDSSGEWWQGTSYSYTETDNGLTLDPGGRATVNDGGDGPGGINGFGFKAAYSQDMANATFTLLDGGGTTQQFMTLSIDIKGDPGNTNPPMGELLLSGVLGSVTNWTIDPVEDNTFHTYTAPTTGDMGLLIDQIVWTAPYDLASAALVWNNQIDNLKVSLTPPAVVSSTAIPIPGVLLVDAQPFGVQDTWMLFSNPDLENGDWTPVEGTETAPSPLATTFQLENATTGANHYRAGKPPVFFFDDFEGGDTWTPAVNAGLGITQWEFGTPNVVNIWLTNQTAASGANCWGTDLDSGYANAIDITLTSPAIDLSAVAATELEWMEWKDIDDTPVNGDQGLVNIIDVTDGTTNLVHTSLSGLPTWTPVTATIPEASRDHVIQIQFQMQSDSSDSSNWVGWYIDDVRIK